MKGDIPEMVERVARAVCQAELVRFGGLSISQMSVLVHRNWRRHVDVAEAVLGAMRNPTDAMVQSAVSVYRSERDPDDMIADWQIMIDRALGG